MEIVSISQWLHPRNDKKIAIRMTMPNISPTPYKIARSRIDRIIMELAMRWERCRSASVSRSYKSSRVIVNCFNKLEFSLTLLLALWIVSRCSLKSLNVWFAMLSVSITILYPSLSVFPVRSKRSELSNSRCWDWSRNPISSKSSVLLESWNPFTRWLSKSSWRRFSSAR